MPPPSSPSFLRCRAGNQQRRQPGTVAIPPHTHSALALHPDEIPRHAQLILVDGDHLPGLEDGQGVGVDAAQRGRALAGAGPEARWSARCPSRAALTANRPRCRCQTHRRRSAPMSSGDFMSAQRAKWVRCSPSVSCPLPTAKGVQAVGLSHNCSEHANCLLAQAALHGPHPRACRHRQRSRGR